MNNKKIILVSVTIIVLAIAGFFFWKFYNPTKKRLPAEEPFKQEQQKRVLPKNTTPTKSTITEDEKEPQPNIFKSQTGNEDLLVTKIEKNIESRDINKIKDSILIVEQNADNESFFEIWRNYLLTNSDTLLTIAKEGDQKLTKGVYFIFEWYIYLSGEFDKLDMNKKETLNKQFLEIKSLLE